MILGASLGLIALTVGGMNDVANDEASHVDAGSKTPVTYNKYCSSCHGPAGRDFVGRTWKLGSTEADVSRVIREGYELLGMPAYGEVCSCS